MERFGTRLGMNRRTVRWRSWVRPTRCSLALRAAGVPVRPTQW